MSTAPQKRPVEPSGIIKSEVDSSAIPSSAEGSAALQGAPAGAPSAAPTAVPTAAPATAGPPPLETPLGTQPDAPPTTQPGGSRGGVPPLPVPVKPRRHYKFAETNDEILKKYEHLPPSLEFQIHENHYRFSIQEGGNIPRNSSSAKKFMEYVLNEEIPPEMVEVLRDGGVQLYEGCVILQISDFRTTAGRPNQLQAGPRTYRTLLRPTQLSLYFDLLYHTDFSIIRFSDQLSLNLEAEILTLTKRNIDLSVPLNPYHYEHLKPDSVPPTVVTDPLTGKQRAVHPHREKHTAPAPVKTAGLRVDKDTHQRSSEYEDLMLIMSNDQQASASTGQFARLRYIEQIRRKMKQAQQQPPAPLGLPEEPDHRDKRPLPKDKKMPMTPVARKNVAGKSLPGHFAGKTVPGAPEEPPAKKKRGTYKKKAKVEVKDGKGLN